MIIAFVAVGILCFSYGYIAGRDSGRATGIAEGWLERQQQLADSDKARRERNGQFKAKGVASR